jgi:hypothetical protein
MPDTFTGKKVKTFTREQIVSAFMVCLGGEKLSEGTWEKLAELNRDILEGKLI